MEFFNIAGGVALAMFGVRFLRKSLDRLFGSHLLAWLQRMALRPTRAFGAGVASGVIAPSSTAQSLLALQLLSTGKLDATGMLAIVLGANLGITFMIQLLALKIQSLGIIFVLVGVLAFQFFRGNLIRGLGQLTLALGFVFLGMNFISLGAADISPTGDFAQILQVAERHAWLLLIIATITTMVLQSSTAAIGLGIGLASQGMLTYGLMIPWVLGVNFGTAMTTLLAGWGQLEGKRLGVANMLSKVVLAAPLLLAMPWVVSSLQRLPGDMPQQMVQLHTGFNLTVGLLALPVLPWLTRAAKLLVPSPPAPPPSAETLSSPIVYLDEKALESPSLALAHATREVLRMSDEVLRMLTTAWSAHVRREAGLNTLAQAHDDRIDEAYIALKKYLSQLSEQDLGERESHWQFTLLSFSNELESVGDIISKNLYDIIHREVTEGHPLTVEDTKALNEVYLRVIERLEMATSLLTSRDLHLARTFLAGKEPLNEWCRVLEKEHYMRLRALRGEGLQSSVYFLEMLNFLRRINSHISSLGYTFIDDQD